MYYVALSIQRPASSIQKNGARLSVKSIGRRHHRVKFDLHPVIETNAITFHCTDNNSSDPGYYMLPTEIFNNISRSVLVTWVSMLTSASPVMTFVFPLK